MDSIEAVLAQKKKFAIFPIVCADHCAWLCKLSLAEVATDGEKLSRVLEYGYKLYRYDMVLVFSDPYVEAQALGCPVEFNPEPQLSGPAPHLTAIEASPADGAVDRTTVIIKAARLLKQRVPVPVFVSIKGPFSLAAFFAGTETFLKLLLTDASKATAVIETAVDFQLHYLERLLELKVNIFIGDPLASASVISPELFAQFAFEPLSRLIKKIKKTDSLVGIHICGETRPIIRLLDALGADILSIEDITPQTKTLKMGGVSTATIFSGNKQKIGEEIQTALTEPSLVLATGCDVPMTTAPEAIKTMITIGMNFSKFDTAFPDTAFPVDRSRT